MRKNMKRNCILILLAMPLMIFAQTSPTGPLLDLYAGIPELTSPSGNAKWKSPAIVQKGSRYFIPPAEGDDTTKRTPVTVDQVNNYITFSYKNPEGEMKQVVKVYRMPREVAVVGVSLEEIHDKYSLCRIAFFRLDLKGWKEITKTSIPDSLVYYLAGKPFPEQILKAGYTFDFYRIELPQFGFNAKAKPNREMMLHYCAADDLEMCELNKAMTVGTLDLRWDRRNLGYKKGMEDMGNRGEAVRQPRPPGH